MGIISLCVCVCVCVCGGDRGKWDTPYVWAQGEV